MKTKLIRLILKILAKKYLKKRGVVALIDGTKVIKGTDTGKKCIKVYVEKKKPLSKINKKDRISKKILLFLKTDVEEMDMPKAYADRKKYRPIQGGCEISPAGDRFVGTAGNIFYQEEVSQEGKFIETVSQLFLSEKLKQHFNLIIKFKWYIGTNLHVGAKGSILNNPIGTKIVQPGVSSYIIGEVIDYIPILKDKINEFDECLIKIDKSFEINREIINVGSVYGFKKPEIGQKVHKYGRTTEYTEGNIIEIGMYLNIDFGIDGIISFKDMVRIQGLNNKSFSAGGDSGSLILANDNYAVARLNSGNGIYSFGIPFPKIMKKLKVWI